MTEPKGRWPNLFILGAPKCGTTSIAHWLSQHPDILMSHPKEPGFFSDDYKDGHFRGRPNRYKNLFAAEALHKFYCDGTVDYLASKNAVPAISKVAPDAKFIVAVRNHADLVFSLHQQERVSGNELQPDFVKAFELSADRRAGRKIPITRPEPKKIDYEERVRMGAQLKRALEYIDRDRLLIVDFDLITSDSPAVWSKICDFLDLSAPEISLAARNPRKSVSSVPFTILRKYLRRIKRTLGVTKNIGLASPIQALATSVPATKPKLDPVLRETFDTKYDWDRTLIRDVSKTGPAALAKESWIDK